MKSLCCNMDNKQRNHPKSLNLIDKCYSLRKSPLFEEMTKIVPYHNDKFNK